MRKMIFEKVHYRAAQLPNYDPLMGFDTETNLYINYSEELLKDDGRKDGDDRDPPICKINYPKPFRGKTEARPIIKNHNLYACSSSTCDSILSRKNRTMKDYKIFHVWEIRVNKVRHAKPYFINYDAESEKIVMKIAGCGEVEKEASFTLNIQDCDKAKSVVVDDELEVDYTLFSKAVRVEIELIPFHADGSAAAAEVLGNVCALIAHKGVKFTHKIFSQSNRHMKSMALAGKDALMLTTSNFILPLDCGHFELNIKLTNQASTFMINQSAMISPRLVATDATHYLFGLKGYIIIKLIWHCLCVDKGICTCASGTPFCFPNTAVKKSYCDNYGNGDSSGSEDSFDIPYGSDEELYDDWWSRPSNEGSSSLFINPL